MIKQINNIENRINIFSVKGADKGDTLCIKVKETNGNAINIIPHDCINTRIKLAKNDLSLAEFEFAVGKSSKFMASGFVMAMKKPQLNLGSPSNIEINIINKDTEKKLEFSPKTSPKELPKELPYENLSNFPIRIDGGNKSSKYFSYLIAIYFNN